MLLFDPEEQDVSINYSYHKISNSVTVYDGMPIGTPIYYNNNLKIFEPNTSGYNKAFVGYFIHYNKVTNLVTVMFKDFLRKNPIIIPAMIKDNYIQNFLSKQYLDYKNSIIEKMPRIKKLKRMNLQMINKTVAVLIHDNIDKIIETYADVFGEENAEILKASIVTTPLYIQDKGYIKEYHFSENELIIPDIESSGNFLSFFLYKDMRINN